MNKMNKNESKVTYQVKCPVCGKSVVIDFEGTPPRSCEDHRSQKEIENKND